MKYQDHTIVMGKIALMLLVLVSGCTGFENTSNPNSISSQVPTPTPSPPPPNTPTPTPNSTPTNTPTPTPNPFESVSFPLDSCGDKLPDDPKVYPVTLHRVFLEYSEDNLTEVRSRFCRDAFKKFNEATGKDEIQVASFLVTERANLFKEFISAKVGISGSIGQPAAIAAKSDRTPAAPTTPSPTSTPNESLITSSDFQDVTIKCREKPTGKYIDLEFGDCSISVNGVQSKNYSSSWYESSSGDNKIELIGPGGELLVDLPKRNYQLGEIRIYQLKVRQLTAQPVRTLSVNCNDPVRIIWGIAVIPKCTSTGSYIDLKTGHGYDSNDYPIVVSAGDSPARFNNNIFEWKSWFFTSKSSHVELTFSVELEK